MRFSLALLAFASPLFFASAASASSLQGSSLQFLKFNKDSYLRAFLNQNKNAKRIHKDLLWVEILQTENRIFSLQEQKSLGIVTQESNETIYRIPSYERPQQNLFDAPSSKLWGISKINAPLAWRVSQGTRDTVVAIVDTGIDYNHPALRENMWRNRAEENGQAGIDDDGNGYVDDIYGADFISGQPTPLDDEGHGSHVAGTVAGNLPAESFFGVAPGISLMAIKTHNNKGEGSKSSVVKGILYAADMGARVLNCSWGGAPEAAGYDQLLFDAIEYANKKGALIVASAGNDSENNDQGEHYPSNYDLPGVLSVAASDKLDRKAYFSNFGVKTVDLAAPGLGIWSVASGGNGFTSLSGTSMASPHVSGAAALLASTELGRTMTAAELRETLMKNVETLSEWRLRVISGGRLDLQFIGRK